MPKSFQKDSVVNQRLQSEKGEDDEDTGVTCHQEVIGRF